MALITKGMEAMSGNKSPSVSGHFHDTKKGSVGTSGDKHDKKKYEVEPPQKVSPHADVIPGTPIPGVIILGM